VITEILNSHHYFIFLWLLMLLGYKVTLSWLLMLFLTHYDEFGLELGLTRRLLLQLSGSVIDAGTHPHKLDRQLLIVLLA
jgi:hypothetical protein